MAAAVVSVHLRGVQFSHSSAVEVFTDVDCDIGPGCHGLVGANGAGKSTLLDLVDGSRPPDRGEVSVIAEGPIVRVHQDPDRMTPDITRFGDRWDGDAVTLRRRLGIDVDDLWQWETRSPGRRMQWQVAAALAARPDVLLLDEPTNHLDARGRQVLVAALHDARTPLVIVVSHDRGILDDLTDTTLRVVDGTLQQWSGSWSRARTAWMAAEAADRAAHDRARQDAARARRMAARARTDLSAVEVGAAATRRAAGTGDPDARSAAAKHHAASAARSLASTVKARRSAAVRADDAVTASAVRRQRGAPVVALGVDVGSDVVASVRARELRAGGHVVARDVDLEVTPGDRIRLAGANGAGKTTLVRALVEPLDRDVVGVMPQDAAVDPATRDRLLGTADRHRTMAILDHLGVDPDRIVTTATLSPGEARKVWLAHLLVRARHLLVLDEPTTHLDIDAIQRLEEALVAYSGALVLVTHDDALAAATTSTTWTIEDGRVQVTT